MAIVKMKIKNSQDNKNKIKLFQILSQNNIHATKILTIQDGYVVIPRTDLEAEFSPLLPPQLKAKRSVILQRVDDFIYI